MSNKKKNLPILLSLHFGHLQLIGGYFIKEGLKVESYTSVRLPLDVVKNGELTEKKIIIQALNNLRKIPSTKKVKNDFCLISLSDEYVFNKLLFLPKIKDEEIKSAVLFQIKKHLPLEPEEVYFDWQVLENGPNEIFVNVVAVRKEIIDSYFETLKDVNLLPIAFQPESCSLASLAALISNEPCLIVYFNQVKAVFSFAQAGVVLLTATFNYPLVEENKQNLQKELIKTIHYWQMNIGLEKKIKNAFLAGAFPQSWLLVQQTIREFLHCPVKKLPLPLIISSHISAERLNSAIPLFGAAFSLIQNSKKRISLIPEVIKKERENFICQNKVKNIFKFASLVLSFLIAVYFFTALSLFFRYKIIQASLSGWEKVIYTPAQASIEKQTYEFNNKIKTLLIVLKQEKKIGEYLAKLPHLLPPGVTITHYQYQSNIQILKLNGFANSRDDLILLEKSLSVLGKVEMPIAHLIEGNQPKFEITIKLKI